MTTDLNTILRLKVPVIVAIGERQMPLEGILALAPGSIVELTKHAEEPLDLRVNNKRIGDGRAVKVGENFGIRISRIDTPESRVQAMGE